MTRQIGFGIVGCGIIAKTHADCISRIKNANLIAVCDQNQQRLSWFRDTYGCKGFTEIDTLLEQPEIDVISILTPSGLHGKIGEKAARYGKHIIVEKPLEITRDKAVSLISATRAAGVKLCAISQHRFDEGIAELKKAITNGEFGELTFGASHTKWYRDQAYYDSVGWRGTMAFDGGGALLNQSVHYIDLLRHLMGEVGEVSAYCATLAHTEIEVEDVGVAAVRFQSGAVGLIEGNTAAWPGYCTRLDIYGTDGSAIVQDDCITDWNLRSGREPGRRAGNNPHAGGVVGELSLDSHLRQYEDMAAAILEDREPVVNGEEALRTLEVIFAIYESARSGRPARPGELCGTGRETI